MKYNIPKCRSNDCDAPAEFYAELPKVLTTRIGQGSPGRPAVVADGWEGNFCGPHLLRTLGMKLPELSAVHTLKIRRIT